MEWDSTKWKGDRNTGVRQYRRRYFNTHYNTHRTNYNKCVVRVHPVWQRLEYYGHTRQSTSYKRYSRVHQWHDSRAYKPEAKYIYY